MKKIGLNAIKTRPHLIAKFPHLFQPGGGFPHFDQILDLTLHIYINTYTHKLFPLGHWIPPMDTHGYTNLVLFNL